MSKKFYLKDWHGKEKEFTDEKIFVRGEDGELIQFTHGEGAVVQPLEVTENGTYTAPDGVDGYSPVTVNVASSGGGGGFPAGMYWSYGEYPLPNNYEQMWFMYNGELHACTNTQSTTSSNWNVYKLVDGAWSLIASGGGSPWTLPAQKSAYELNGKIHMLGRSSYHFIFDGTSITANAKLPNQVYSDRFVFIQGGKLKAYTHSDGSVYVYDEGTNTWTAEAKISNNTSDYYYFATIGEDVYCYLGNELFKYENGAITKIATLSQTPANHFVYKSCIYYSKNNSAFASADLYKYDPATGTETFVGCGAYGLGRSIMLNGNMYILFGSPSAKMFIARMHEVTE